ncbi:MAG: nucleotidyltransferase family protein [Blastocatellia bacterium]|nr:nucleotidyltransferase family protein [Blastocatellia bacterium]
MKDKNQILDLLREHRGEILRRYAVRDLFVFGSVARDEARDGSDVDLLVEFDGPATFDGYMDLKFFLEDLLKMPVDLVTQKGLRREIRPIVEKEAIHVA